MLYIPRTRWALARLFISIALFASVVDAHAILKSAVPGSGQVVQGAEVAIELRFNSRIDGKRSRITLVVPDGSTKPLAIRDQAAPDILNAQAEGLKSGSYTIRWQVLANDGHISRGEVPFRVQ